MASVLPTPVTNLPTAGNQKTDSGSAPELSIIIVNYNVKEFLEPCLNSLKKALSGISSEIIVVDNASDDGSDLLIRRQFPEVKYIQNAKNLGFARANNIAMREAAGRFIVLMNPDTIAQQDTFEELLKFMKNHPEAGMVGCKILNPDGSLQLACRRSFPTPWVAFTRLTGLSFLFPKSKIFGRYNLTYLPENEIRPVEAISGSFMMVRREVIEQVGMLDEDYFLYGEDLDWCYRTRSAGWTIYYVPTTQIVHFKGESSKKSQLDNVMIFYQSMALFVKKHFRERYFSVTYFLLLIAIWIRAAVSVLQKSARYWAPPLIDVVWMQISLLAALWIKFGHLHFWRSYVPVTLVYTTVWLLVLYFWGSYGRWRFSFSRAFAATLTGFFFNSAFTYFFKQFAYSRAVLLLASGLNVFALSGWRLCFKLLHRFGLAPFIGTLGHTLLARRTVIVGDFSKGEKILSKLKSRIGHGYEIIGLISLNPRDLGKSYNGVKVIGTIDNLFEAVRDKNIQEVIFSTHRIQYHQILKIIAANKSQKVNFKLIPTHLDVIIGKASIDQISDVPVVDIEYRLSHRGYRAMKRLFDLFGASLLLMVTGPLYLFHLKLKRAETEQKTVAACEKSPQIQVREIKGKKIPSLAPWLWLVIQGRLSLVGREPEISDIPEAISRFLKPGLTGLVQVNRDKNLTKKEKEKYQLFYLTNYSPLLDLEILFKAIFKV